MSAAEKALSSMTQEELLKEARKLRDDRDRYKKERDSALANRNTSSNVASSSISSSDDKKFMGEWVSSDTKMDETLGKMTQRIVKNKGEMDNLKVRVKKLNEFNRKLSDSYVLSVQMVIKVTNLMKKYTLFFQKLDEFLTTFDQNIISEDDLRFITQATQSNINKLNSTFNNELDNLIMLFSKDAEHKSKVEELKKLQGEVRSNMGNYVLKPEQEEKQKAEKEKEEKDKNNNTLFGDMFKESPKKEEKDKKTDGDGLFGNLFGSKESKGGRPLKKQVRWTTKTSSKAVALRKKNKK